MLVYILQYEVLKPMAINNNLQCQPRRLSHSQQLLQIIVTATSQN